MNDKNKDYIHKEFPKTKDPKDFWGQIKRTINGEPVGEDQILMIVKAVSKGLHFENKDVLLDLGCGNGALTRYFYDSIKKSIGIDFSEYLIQVAKDNFERNPNNTFYFGDAIDFVSKYQSKNEITKALCYGVFSYFDKINAEKLLLDLSLNYSNLEKLYIGNLPNKEKADKFYYKDIDFKKLLDDNQSSIGIWRSHDEMIKLGEKTGWNCEIIEMADNFYGSHYRFDVIMNKK
jgi:SAM-dependent methyltransferase